MFKSVQELYQMTDKQIEEYIEFLKSAIRSANDVKETRF